MTATGTAWPHGLAKPDLDVLRAVVDAVPSRVSLVTPEHRYLYANREFLNFVGLPLDDLVGKAASDVLGPQVYAAFVKTARKVTPSHAPNWEGWITFAGSKERYIQVTMAPYAPGGGGIQAIFVLARDLTDLKLRERQLDEAAQVYSEIVRSALDAFILADDAGRVHDFNPAAEEMLGYSRTDAIGQRLTDLMIPQVHRAAHEAGMVRYMTTGQSRILGKRMQLEALAANGELIPVEVTLNEVKLPDRRVFTAHMRDLRDTKKAQAEIESQRSRIHQIEKLSAMGSLLAGVAHELNNPLAILVAQATLLREKAQTDDMRQRAERIHAAAERAGRIVKSFLAMARQKPPVREPTNLNKLAADTLEMLAYGLRTAGIEVKREFDPATPELKLDADMFRQVIANMVMNSQQVLMNMPKPRSLAIRTRAGADHILFEIEDNGQGVPAEIAARIFEPFFTTKPAGVGTGIGLSICRDIVQAHDGKLELVDTQGAGALFRITLPRQVDEPLAVAADAGGPRQENILIIDDEVDVGESLGEILEALGHRATVTASARQGLELAERQRFDRIFVDLRMPEMSGQEVLKAIAGKFPGLAARSVLMTGDTVRGPALLLGDAELKILEKPFSLDDIRGIMAGS